MKTLAEPTPPIRTPDQCLRVFVSSTMRELERFDELWGEGRTLSIDESLDLGFSALAGA